MLSQEPAKRKLAAILHADVVGYSRLMGEDERGTHARLVAARRLFAEVVGAHDGRIVGTAGDAILADFPSVVEALAAAIAVQESLAGSAAGDPTRLAFRIGINLGDVIVEGDDILGDGVNVAARVQALAAPGGIAVSGAVYDQVRAKLDLAFHDQGAHRVKNIADPVRVYSVGRAGSGPRPAAGRRHRRPAIAATVVIAMALAAGVVWTLTEIGTTGRQPETPVDAAAPSDGMPTIAVLPFENHGDDPTQSYFSDGVTEDVIGDLGRFSNLLVLSWSAVAPYRDRAVAPEALGRDLGVRYVVAGSVRRDGERLRITAQLTDAERGILLWSERYDRSLDDVFAVQDDIARRLVGTLAVRLTRLERERAAQQPTESLDAYDLVLRGRHQVQRIERAANLQARALFERAIVLDPGYADAYVGLGQTHLHDFMYGWTERMARAIDQAESLAEQAIRLDRDNAAAHALVAACLTFRSEFERAEQSIEQALALNPNNALNLAIQGTVSYRAGRPEEAVASMERALRLDPNMTAWAVASLIGSYYFLGRYEDTISAADRLVDRAEEDPVVHMFRAAAHGQLGNSEEAAAGLAELLRISPFFNARVVASSFAVPEHRAHLLEGLGKAGLD